MFIKTLKMDYIINKIIKYILNLIKKKNTAPTINNIYTSNLNFFS